MRILMLHLHELVKPTISSHGVPGVKEKMKAVGMSETKKFNWSDAVTVCLMKKNVLCNVDH